MPARALALSLAFALALLSSRTEVVRAQSPDTTRLAGLSQPVEIIRDRQGISHIYARNEHDLFYAQGWSAASA